MMTLRRTKLAPISAKRLAEFRALGIHPASTFKPKPPTAARTKPKRWADTGPDDETVRLVLKRDQWRCTCCGDPIYGHRGSEWSISHRKLKSRGLDNRPCNLALVCGDGLTGCHGEIHRNPTAATEAGWMVSSADDPESMAFEHYIHGRVWLLADGSVSWSVPSLEGAVE